MQIIINMKISQSTVEPRVATYKVALGLQHMHAYLYCSGSWTELTVLHNAQ